MNAGFTLIELSIVLVITGLIIGGILVGQDLIKAAAVRAQISQIEKYQTAVNTFRGKYGYLPGDITDPTATNYGFTPRGPSWAPGEGDGNGVIECNWNFAPGANYGLCQGDGEAAMFWQDLTYAGGQNINFIDGSFNINPSTTMTQLPASSITGTTINQYFPQAKIGGGNFIYVYSAAYLNAGFTWVSSNINYFGLSAITKVDVASFGYLDSQPGLTVQQAYAIDSKIDDGFPMTGRVTAQYVNSNAVTGAPAWAAASNLDGANSSPGSGPMASLPGPTTTATAYLSTNCYDNNGVVGPQKYSMSQNANSLNCALSFRFQ